jgi:hypothetical protein
MKPGLLFAALCLCLPMLAATPQPVAAQSQDPLSIVREIYLQYAEDGEVFDVPEKYFSQDLLTLWREVENGEDDGDVERALGFAVFKDSRDDEVIEIDDVRLQLVAKKYVIASYVVLAEGEDAIAATKKYFQYNFNDSPGGWKIDNIDWGPDRKTLRDYLAEVKALQAMQDKAKPSP